MPALRRKPVFKVSNRNGSLLLYSAPPAVAKEAIKVAHDLPPRPPGFDDALVKAARRRPRINLAHGWATTVIGRDTATVTARVMAGESVKHQPKFAKLVSKLTDKHWTEVVLKLRHRFNDLLTVRVVAVKGLLFELWVRQLPKFEELLVRCSKKLRTVAGWHQEVFVVRAARTLDDGQEVADYLVVAFDRVDNPREVWVLAVIESKSEHNAISIARHESKSALAALGKDAELLGQPRQSLRRIRQTGVDLTNAVVDGRSRVENLGQFKPEQIRISNEAGREFGQQTTELIGVVPPDTPQAALRRITRDAPKQGIQVWLHETTGMETNFLSYEVIKAFEE
jgi:hypothetical protein